MLEGINREHFPLIGFFFILFLLITATGAHANSDTVSDAAISDQVLKTRPKDSVKQKRRWRDTSFVYEYIAHPVLRAVTWPIETFVVPVFKMAFYPARPPVQYLLNENVLDKTIEVISFGQNDQIMIYPTVVITTGTGSMMGLTLRHSTPFGRKGERLIASTRFFVNGNLKSKARLYFTRLPIKGMRIKLLARHDWVKNQGIPPPGLGGKFKYYSDTTWGGTVEVMYKIFKNTEAFVGYDYRDHKYTFPPVAIERVECGEDGYFFKDPDCIETRALNTSFKDYIYTAGFDRNTINNENIPTAGSRIEFWWSYHDVTGNRDFHEWDFKFQKFFFLGVERYEISPKEQREMGTLNFQKIRETLKVKNLKRRLFKRKVIALQIKAGQAYEMVKGRSPVYVFHNLGNSTPLRGYTASPFRDMSMLAYSMEYRFPIMRLVEGTIFNEYGIVGKKFSQFKMKELRNSWGFGIRMARKDIFLFRAQLGFHGLNSPVVNITVDTVY